MTPQGLLKKCSPISTMRINELEEGMFAYGTTPGSRREGTIGWVSRINHQKKKVGITYQDGRTATWNVGNIVVAHSEEAYDEGITTCELYLQFVQRQSRRTYKNRRSYREMNESVPRTVPPDEYQDDAPPVASRVYAMQADEGLVGNGNGNRTDVAIQELTNTLRELMHITRETSNRVRGLEERVSRVEMEAVSVNTDAMSGATTNAETVSGGEIGEIG